MLANNFKRLRLYELKIFSYSSPRHAPEPGPIVLILTPIFIEIKTIPKCCGSRLRYILG